jgi:hypothetical protein
MPEVTIWPMMTVPLTWPVSTWLIKLSRMERMTPAEVGREGLV